MSYLHKKRKTFTLKPSVTFNFVNFLSSVMISETT